MTRDALEALICRALVDCLSDRVVAALRARRRTGLVLFTGTDLGLSRAAASLRTLGEDGWTLHAALSPRARAVLPPGALAAAGLAEPAAGIGGEDADALLDGCAALLVATLTVTTAAKLACGIRDGLAARLPARALERDVPVIAAVDGCCPDNPERAARGFLANEAYRARLRANLETLRGYGVRLVRAEGLASALSMPRSAAPVGARPDPVPAPAAGRRVFSRTDAALWRGGEVRLARDVLVTPLAIDELRSRNIRLVQG